MWRRLLGLAAGVTALFAPAQAQPVAPVPTQSAPASWIQYAKLLETTFESRVGSSSEQARRLRVYLAQIPGGKGVIAVQVWVDGSGMVSRVAFAPFLDAQANADLTGLLQGSHLTESPPAGILLPIRLNLHVAAGDGASESAPADQTVH